MLAKRLFFLMILICMVFTGCSGNQTVKKQKKNNENSKIQSDATEYESITEKELESEYLNKNMSETLSVAASITPLRLYKNGINVYIVDLFGTANGSKKYTAPVKKTAKRMEKLLGISAEWDKMDKIRKYCTILPFSDVEQGGKMIFTDEYFQFQFGNNELYESYKNIVIRWNKFVPKQEKDNLAFIDMEDAETEIREVISGVTNTEISNQSFGESFHGNSIDVLGEYYAVSQDLQNHPNFYADDKNGFYYFNFYLSQDGIKIDDFLGDFYVDEDISYPETVYIGNDGMGTLLGQARIEAIYTSNGLLYLNIPEVIEISDIYNTVEVISINELIEKIEEYFASQLGMPKIEISRMELMYDTGISDTIKDKEAKVILKPYWIVEYFDKREVSDKNWKYKGWEKLIFDAATGELVKS